MVKYDINSPPPPTNCLQPIPNTREALLSSIQPFLHLTQKKIWHRVPPFLHRYYNIYKVRFAQIFQFVQIQPYNILFICQMPLTLPQRSSFLIVRDIVCRSPIGRTLWSNIRIVDWRWAISASTHRNESLIGLSQEPPSVIPTRPLNSVRKVMMLTSLHARDRSSHY